MRPPTHLAQQHQQMGQIHRPIGNHLLPFMAMQVRAQPFFQAMVRFGPLPQYRDDMLRRPWIKPFGQSPHCVELGVITTPVGYQTDGDQRPIKAIPLTWGLSAVGQFLALIALASPTPATVLYFVVWILMCIAVTTVLLVRRNHVSTATTSATRSLLPPQSGL